MAEIALTRGKVALVDDADLALVSRFKWCAKRHRRTWYAETWNGGDHLYMHSLILGAKGCDHVNGDGLDNRRENLRTATPTENNRNRRPIGASRFKGVSPRKSGTFRAAIKVAGKTLWLGVFSTEEEAARAYDAAAVEHFGEFAWLNFPVRGEAE